MIDRKQLLADLKPLLKQLEADLRARCDEVAEIGTRLQREYKEARDANRTGAAIEEWRADLITQVAVAWVLSCVFVRFLEDNALIAPPRISGPLHGAGDDAGLQRARDEREHFFKSHPKQTDRDYLLSVFDDLAKLPGTKDVFGAHNVALAYRDWLSGDAAQKLIEFFQKVDADGTGELIHDFTDATWDTRFLGDLYQDLSEAARKKYALLQTPIFVEEFILERTLEPAINEFGIKNFKMIDPACGSGHFLLGAFARILEHWRKREPGTSERELVNSAVASIHGVDLNPYAVAIARFRLLIAAIRECQITRLKDAPAFAFNLVCGDSLLHGSPGNEQQILSFHDLAHAYESEDLSELQRILTPGFYHAVVANPPYIAVKDKALNEAYRERYPEVCHLKYSLAVPFLQRIFMLACESGFTGQITANSFMKREFGKKLIESYLPTIDITHVVDTGSHAFIPGHATPTVILFGRSRRPISPTVRAVLGIKGEPCTPDEPSKGLFWTAILAQIDRPGSESEYVSVNDTLRDQFAKHPWSIGGGGASELKVFIDDCAMTTLGQICDSAGVVAVTLEDDAYASDRDSLNRARVSRKHQVGFVEGDKVRDWRIDGAATAVLPYDIENEECEISTAVARCLWPYRTGLASRLMFKKTQIERGYTWFEYGMLIWSKFRSPLSIAFSFVATHNHFVLDRGGKIFNRSAPVIKLPPNATQQEHLGLLGLLNSSLACFWMKQVFYPKATSTGDISIVKGKPEANRYEFTATGLDSFPIPIDVNGSESEVLRSLSKDMVELADGMQAVLPASVVADGAIDKDSTALRSALCRGEASYLQMRQRMMALQEELDWECYRQFGLCKEGASHVILANSNQGIPAEVRPFLWESDECPTSVPPEWRGIYERRRRLLASSQQLTLIENLVFKRPWWGRQGVYGRLSRDYNGWQREALATWLVSRLEDYFDLDGRMNDRKETTASSELREPRLTSVAKMADIARQDKGFMQLAEVYAGRMDFDVGALVGVLIAAESVPALPVLRYKLAAMDKRRAWERTWELQRLEDSVDALFDRERLKKIDVGKAEETLHPQVAALRIEEATKPQVLRETVTAADYIAEAVKQNLNLASDDIIKPVQDAAKRAKKAAVGDIPVPPKYTGADFLSSDYWRLRGKLDVPKERWVSFPHCEGEDGSLVIAWAGYDHLQLARAIAERYELAKEHEGRKLVPLLAAIGQLIPWLKQWHNDLDPVFNQRMGDYFEGYLAEEAKALGMSVADVMGWAPPEMASGRGRKKKAEVAV